MNQTFDFERAGKLIDRRLNELLQELVARRLDDPTDTPEYNEMLVVVKKLEKTLNRISQERTVS